METISIKILNKVNSKTRARTQKYIEMGQSYAQPIHPSPELWSEDSPPPLGDHYCCTYSFTLMNREYQ